jgi:hypothetical protein
MGISGRRLPRVECAGSRAGGCSFADLGLTARARHASRRALGAVAHVGIPTSSSGTFTELERTHTGVASRHARAFVGRARTIFSSAACTAFSSAAASGHARRSFVGRTRRAGSRAG